MCAKPSTVYRGNTSNKPEEIVNFREVFSKYSFHWPLFVLFFVVTMIMAFVYFKVAKPSYEIKATLQIKDDTKDNKPQADKTPLEQIDLATPPKIVENEMEIIRSVRLLSKVVYDLQLWVNYTRKTKVVKEENLYKKSPVYFKVWKLKNGLLGGQKFEVVIKDRNTFLLKRSDGKYAQFQYKNLLSNDFGLWQLLPTKDLDYYIGQTITIKVADPTSVVNSYQGGLNISLVDKLASTLSLSLNDPIAQRGKDFLNDLISRYDEAATMEKNDETQKTLDFIDKRLASLTGELNQANAKVAAYQSEKGLTDLDKQSEIYTQNQSRNDESLNDVNIQLGVINEIENYVNSPHSNNVPSTLGIKDDGLSSLIDKLAQLQLERDRLLATTPESNPIFDPINRQIKATRSSIMENVRNIKNSLLAQKRQYVAYGGHVESTIKSVPNQAKEFIGLKRDQTLKENLYTYLLQKREEISLSYASILTDARLVDSAYVLPVKAVKKYAPFGVAFALSFLMPIGLIFGRSSIKNAVTTIKEIKKDTNVPILCELSYEKTKSPIVVHDRGKFAIAEEFRTLRTKLHYLHENKDKGRVTLVTSSISSEGKSFISSNLAVAIAASGRKTAILEMDLRKPRISAIFGVEDKHAGISNYLNGEASEAKIGQTSTSYPNLDVFVAGDFYPNPSELLEQDRLANLINWLRANYDDVIIDTPPVNVVTDAAIVAKLVDVTLFTIRQGYTSRVLLPVIENISLEQTFPNMNLVFNGIERGRYGYSGYGYGYGDYVSDKKAKRKYSNSIFRDFFKRF